LPTSIRQKKTTYPICFIKPLAFASRKEVSQKCTTNRKFFNGNFPIKPYITDKITTAALLTHRIKCSSKEQSFVETRGYTPQYGSGCKFKEIPPSHFQANSGYLYFIVILRNPMALPWQQIS